MGNRDSNASVGDGKGKTVAQTKSSGVPPMRLALPRLRLSRASDPPRHTATTMLKRNLVTQERIIGCRACWMTASTQEKDDIETTVACRDSRLRSWGRKEVCSPMGSAQAVQSLGLGPRQPNPLVPVSRTETAAGGPYRRGGESKRRLEVGVLRRNARVRLIFHGK